MNTKAHILSIVAADLDGREIEYNSDNDLSGRYPQWRVSGYLDFTHLKANPERYRLRKKRASVALYNHTKEARPLMPFWIDSSEVLAMNSPWEMIKGTETEIHIPSESGVLELEEYKAPDTGALSWKEIGPLQRASVTGRRRLIGFVVEGE
jgi:hypothetical protein